MARAHCLTHPYNYKEALHVPIITWSFIDALISSMLAFLVCVNRPAGVIIIEIYITNIILQFFFVVYLLLLFFCCLHKIIIGSSCSWKVSDEMSKGQVQGSLRNYDDENCVSTWIK